MRPIINIGANFETVKLARQAVLEILNHKRSDEIVLEALKTFAHICDASPTTISHCIFNAEATKKRSGKK